MKSKLRVPLQFPLAFLALALVATGCESTEEVKLQQLQIEPAEVTLEQGTTQQFTVKGTYSDQSTKELTADANWAASAPTLASFAGNTKGLLTAVATGDFTVTATVGDVTANAAVKVVPAKARMLGIDPGLPKVVKGTTLQLTATATYPGNRTQNVSSTATWSTENGNVATVSSSGVVTGVTPGTVKIKARIDDVEAQVTLRVEEVKLTEIMLSPATPSTPMGMTVQLTATGKFSDQSTQPLTESVTWESADVELATVSNEQSSRGLVTGVTKGTVRITATLDGVSKGIDVVITDATLVSVSIEPVNPDVVVNSTKALKAMALMSDDSTQDVTSAATWSATDTTVVEFSTDPAEKGLMRGLTLGSTDITVSYMGKTDTTTATVIPLAVTKVEVDEKTPTAAKGTTVQLHATATYNDGSTEDVTSQVGWAFDEPNFVSISNNPARKGQTTALKVGTVGIHVVYDTGTETLYSESVTFTITPAVLTSVAVTPATVSIERYTTRQFLAKGMYSDQTSQDLTTQVTWSSSDTAKAPIEVAGANIGRVTAVDTGEFDISATFNGVQSNVAKLTITHNPLQSIELYAGNGAALDVPKGLPLQLLAKGNYQNNVVDPLTNPGLVWESSNPGVAEVGVASGLVTTVSTGTTEITAKLRIPSADPNGTLITSAPITITVTPEALKGIIIDPMTASINKGQTRQFTATGTYTDNSEKPLTMGITWASDDDAIATIDDNGLASGTGGGEAKITASVGAITSLEASLTVVALTSVTIDLTPPATGFSLARGVELQLSATAHYSNGTNTPLLTGLTWGTGSNAIATVSAAGVLKGVADGTTYVTVTFDGVTSAQVPVTVTPATLVTIVVTPSPASVPLGEKLQFVATGHFSDNSQSTLTSTVTWESATPAIASISGTGEAHGLAQGTTTITASQDGVQSTGVTLTVTAPVLKSIAITPSSATSIVRGTKQAFTATGTYSDGHTDPITATVTWESSDTSIVAWSGTTAGEATAVKVGTTNITARVGNIVSPATELTVTLPALQSLAVSMMPASVGVGGTKPITVTATYADGGTAPLTSGVTWSQNTFVSISDANLVSGLSAGTAQVTATVGTVSSAPFELTVVPLTSIAVSPAAPVTLEAGKTRQLEAVGTWGDSTTGVITVGLTWHTGDAAVAVVSTAGLLSGVTVGTTEVWASHGAVESNHAAVTVIPACTANVVINELQTGSGTPFSRNHEFVELYNPCLSAIDVSGWKLVLRRGNDATDIDLVTFATGTSIGGGQFFLAGRTTYIEPDGVTVDVKWTATATDAMQVSGGSVGLRNAAGTTVDALKWGAISNNGQGEGTAVTYTIEPDPPQSISRKEDGVDTNDNNADFHVVDPTPRAANN